MALGIITAVRSNMMTQILNAIDAGAAGGKLRIYDGSRPATGGTATTLLAELTLSATSGTVLNGVLTFAAITRDEVADNGGTATWFRIVDSDNNFVCDGSVTAAGGGGDLQLITTTVVAGQPVEVSSFIITAGNA